MWYLIGIGIYVISFFAAWFIARKMIREQITPLSAEAFWLVVLPAFNTIFIFVGLGELLNVTDWFDRLVKKMFR